MDQNRDDDIDFEPKDATGSLVCFGAQSAHFIFIKMDDGNTAFSTDSVLYSTIEAIRRKRNWVNNTITVKFKYISVKGIRMIRSVQSLQCMDDVGYVTINRADPTAPLAPEIVGQVSDEPPTTGNILSNSSNPSGESPTSLDSIDESSSDGAFCANKKKDKQYPSNIESAHTRSNSGKRGFPFIARPLHSSSTFQVTSEQSPTVSGESLNDQWLPMTSNCLPLNAPFDSGCRNDPRSEHGSNGFPGKSLISFPTLNVKASGSLIPKIDSRSPRVFTLDDNFRRCTIHSSPNTKNLINDATFSQMSRPLNAANSPFRSVCTDSGPINSLPFGVSSGDTRSPAGGPTLPTFMTDKLASLALHSLPNGVSADIPVTTGTVNPRSRIAKPKFRNMTLNLDDCDDAILHEILNEWYYEPYMLNKPTYPFVVSGLIDKSNFSDSRFTFLCRRTGSLIIQDTEERKNAIYGYCLVMGPGNYRAWEFDKLPPSIKSTKFLKNGGIELKGYGILAATSEKSEWDWLVWNDQLGLMPCRTSAGRNIKQKYKDWTPTLQAVMFDAVDEGKWKVVQLSHVPYDTMEKNNWFPKQMYFVNDAVKMPSVKGAPMKFYSDRLRAEIKIKRRENVIDENHEGKFEAFLIFDWHTALDGEFFALAVYPPRFRVADENSLFQKLVSHVHIVENWETDNVLCSPFENYERSRL